MSILIQHDGEMGRREKGFNNFARLMSRHGRLELVDYVGSDSRHFVMLGEQSAEKRVLDRLEKRARQMRLDQTHVLHRADRTVVPEGAAAPAEAPAAPKPLTREEQLAALPPDLKRHLGLIKPKVRARPPVKNTPQQESTPDDKLDDPKESTSSEQTPEPTPSAPEKDPAPQKDTGEAATASDPELEDTQPIKRTVDSEKSSSSSRKSKTSSSSKKKTSKKKS